MAKVAKKLPNNCVSSFFVDNTCIDCGTCYWVAPDTFKRDGNQSTVYFDPKSEEQVQAIRARKKAQKQKEKDVDQLKEDVSELKGMMKLILEKLDGS